MIKWPRQTSALYSPGTTNQTEDHSAWDDRAVHLGVNLLFLCSLFLFVSVLFSFRQVPPIIPFHYSLPWGTQQLVSRPTLWLVAGLGILSAAVHAFLAASIFRTDRLMAQIAVWIAVLNLLLLTFGVLTVYVRVGPL